MPHPAKTTKLGILLSGRGSNMVAIADRIAHDRTEDREDGSSLRGAEIAVVISNVADAPGLAEAQKRGLKTVTLESAGKKRAEHDTAVRQALEDNGVELVILAGYMRLLSPEFVRAYPQRILNIHPSLLPAFPGLDAQQQAWEYGVKVAGCTVHFVDEQLDHGVIVLQRTVEVAEDDTAESLSAKILREEHVAYSDGIARVIGGEWSVQGRRFVASKQ